MPLKLTSPVANHPPKMLASRCFAGPGARHDREATIWLFVTAQCVLLLTHNGGLAGLDGQTYYEAARSLVEQQRLDVGAGFNSTTGLGGREYAKGGIGLPLLAAAVYFASAPVSWWVPAHADLIRTALVGASMTSIVAGIVAAVSRLARTLGARASSSLIVGAGAVAGTFLLPYSKEFFAEPLAALGIVIAIERTLAGRPGAAGLGLATAVLARAPSLLVVPPVMLVILRRAGVRGAVRAAIPVSVALLLTVGYNVARFGDPLSFGYQHEGFTTPIPGTRMLLLDPSKSLFLFVPVAGLFPWAFARLWRQNRDAFLLITSTLAITFVVAAAWHNPNGGWCWGPRLLIPGIPAAVAALGPWIDRPVRQKLAAALLVTGFAVSAPAVAVSTLVQQLDVPPPPGRVWPADMGLPTIGRQAELVPVTAAYTMRHLYERQEDGRNNLRSLAFWQLGLARVLGVPGLLAAAASSLFLVAAAAWAAWRCRLALPN